MFFSFKLGSGSTKSGEWKEGRWTGWKAHTLRCLFPRLRVVRFPLLIGPSSVTVNDPRGNKGRTKSWWWARFFRAAIFFFHGFLSRRTLGDGLSKRRTNRSLSYQLIYRTKEKTTRDVWSTISLKQSDTSTSTDWHTPRHSTLSCAYSREGEFDIRGCSIYWGGEFDII